MSIPNWNQIDIGSYVSLNICIWTDLDPIRKEFVHLPVSAVSSHSTNFLICSRKILRPFEECFFLYHSLIAFSLRTSSEKNDNKYCRTRYMFGVQWFQLGGNRQLKKINTNYGGPRSGRGPIRLGGSWVLPRFFWVPGVFSRDENSRRQKSWKYCLSMFLKAKRFYALYMQI
jgi:hypothetical protein